MKEAMSKKELLEAPGIATSNKKLLGAPGLTTRNKNATSNKGHQVFFFGSCLFGRFMTGESVAAIRSPWAAWAFGGSMTSQLGRILPEDEHWLH